MVPRGIFRELDAAIVIDIIIDMADFKTERQRDSETERQRDRETERQRQRDRGERARDRGERDRQRDRAKERQRRERERGCMAIEMVRKLGRQ
jgi:hypothetical protein